MGKRKKSAEAAPGDGNKLDVLFRLGILRILRTHIMKQLYGGQRSVLVAGGITLYTTGTGGGGGR